MKTTISIAIMTILLSLSSCRQTTERKEATEFKYFDITVSDTIGGPMSFAVTDEEFLQYGARVAYVSNLGDTIIPFGKYAYLGTDTLVYYANVLESPNLGRKIGID